MITCNVQAKRLKTIMIAAAEYAALRLQDFTSPNPKLGHRGSDSRDRIFRLLDKNGDGKISIEELTEVMIELGAQGDDAREMMQLLDSNNDGSLSFDEFNMFQKRVTLINVNIRDGERVCRVASQNGFFLLVEKSRVGLTKNTF